MCEIIEGKLKFVFPAEWQAESLDKTAFYREHFQKLADSKSVDIVAFSIESDEVWMIEVKDYRINRREKSLDLFREIAIKVRDTLACLYLAKGKSELGIHQFTRHAVNKLKIRVVLHLEQPTKSSKLYPSIVERDKGRLKLAQAVRVVDPHPLYCEMSAMPSNCPWWVSES